MSMSRELPDISPVLEFLPCRTPAAWVSAAAAGLDTLLLDHASLELKAAEQAQRLIRKYSGRAGAASLPDGFTSRLVRRMSRLAREELRHFERVVSLIEARGKRFVAISPSRYAAGLHACARSHEPEALIDVLIIGAVIEARSCERFYSLLEPLETVDREVARFYRSLLRSEARHFEDYLDLARELAGTEPGSRIAELLARDQALVESSDTLLRFHSGPVSESPPSQSRQLSAGR